MWAYLLHDTTDAKNTKADYTEYIGNAAKFRSNINNFLARCRAPSVNHGDGKLDQIISSILNGTMTKKQLLMPDILPIYHANYSKIDTALKLRNQSLIYNAPKCRTIYIHGKSGSGKTTLAQEIAIKEHKNDYAFASSQNDLLQDYAGEKCLIIDDFRNKQFDFINLLALLDPVHRQRSHQSRYYNKPLATELIIITSTVSFDNVMRDYEIWNPREDMKQLRRRVQTIKNTDTGEELIYIEELDEYASLIDIDTD